MVSTPQHGYGQKGAGALRGIYAIVDVDALDERGIDAVAFAQAVLEGRPGALQVRAKRTGAGRTLRILEAVRQLSRAVGTLLIANDRPDLAVLAGADGVHLGQQDLSVADARRVIGEHKLMIGVSTHNEEELEQAIEDGADYIAMGPVFGTKNKRAPEPTLGLPQFRALALLARKRAPKVPLVAIGGIDGSNLDQVHSFVDAVAVIGALLPDSASLKPLLEASARTSALASALASSMAAVEARPARAKRPGARLPKPTATRAKPAPRRHK